VPSQKTSRTWQRAIFHFYHIKYLRKDEKKEDQRVGEERRKEND